MRGRCGVRSRGFIVPLLLVGVLGLVGCGEGEPPPGEAPSGELPAGAAPQRETLSRDRPSPLPSVRAELVQGWSGPGGEAFEVALRTSVPPPVISRRIGPRTFPLGLRLTEPDLGQYPCISCHIPDGPAVDPDGRTADAHRDIRPPHPDERGDTCTTCHVADRVDELELASGERVGLDHAYRLCAECHGAEVRAWAGGAHGKRLDQWQGRRVVMGCAECHDPHAPELEVRIPFPGPRLPLGGRDR